MTERIVVASKGRFDRSLKAPVRKEQNLPHRVTIGADEFMESTLDVWHFASESAKRVGHPAPFPVALPERLIHMHTYADELVLDPFLGSGSTLVAAARTGRRFVGYDLDPAYCELAKARVSEEFAEMHAQAAGSATENPVASDPALRARNTAQALVAQFTDDGLSTNEMAKRVLHAAGFTMEKSDVRIPDTGMIIPFIVRDAQGAQWYVDLCGTNIASRGGLNRLDTTWRAIARGSILEGVGAKRLLMLTPKMARPKSEQDRLIRGWLSTRNSATFHAQLIDLSDPTAVAELITR